MVKRYERTIGASLITLMWLASAQPALGQSGAEPTATVPEEDAARDVIIVTAQKRAENVQDVPIAITALNAEQLAAAKVEDSKDLQFNAPNVTLSANRNL